VLEPLSIMVCNWNGRIAGNAELSIKPVISTLEVASLRVSARVTHGDIILLAGSCMVGKYYVPLILS
jgi:hypothetical protein